MVGGDARVGMRRNVDLPTPGGSGTSERSSTSNEVGEAAVAERPVNWWRSQNIPSPRRQATQRPQLYGG